MEPKTLEALKASIEKWKRNAVAMEPWDYHTSPEDCPLCTLFFEDGCSGCPIAEKTGATFCQESPYDNASVALYRWHRRIGRRATALKAALAEVAFLESLLPEGERP